MSNIETKYNDKNKIANATQVDGIESSILDNDPERATRIAWINTGTGLRYKTIIDRAMDIIEALSLAWLSYVKSIRLDSFSDVSMDWARNFGGGLLTICGLSNIGNPEKDEACGLHGQISNTPAKITSTIQSDPVAGKMEMSIIGIVRVMQLFGTILELKRTISGTLSEAKTSIQDVAVNCDYQKVTHMLFYHLNFGEPKLLRKGSWQSPSVNSDKKVFKEENDYRLCSPPMASNSGSVENMTFIDIEVDEDEARHCGLYNRKLNLASAMQFQTKQLPWLTNWQHWGKNKYLATLEPATNPRIGQRGEPYFFRFRRK